jgi:hypothetical protein
MDFSLPIGKTWGGYLIPENLKAIPCLDCNQNGCDANRQWVIKIATLLCMVGEDVHNQKVGRDLGCHLSRIPNHPKVRPDARILELVNILADEEPFGGLGYGSGAWYRVAKAIIKSAGLPEDWGICTTCQGEGTVDAYLGQEALRDAWESTQPPVGEGWQLWETISEGSPYSPVFATAQELAHWMATVPDDYGNLQAKDYDTALRFITFGWAPSGVWDEDGNATPGVDIIGKP